LGNSIQSYVSLAGTQQVYAGPAPKSSSSNGPSSALPAGIPASTLKQGSTSPVTGLSARTFGTWTLLSSIVRLYAAYNIENPAMYEICLWTFVIAFGHFMSEWLVFSTARWGRGLAGPAAVSTLTTVWMLVQWKNYVQ
jgi:hypothetical protein